MQLLALDVALLPPPDVRQRAIELNAALPAEGSDGLQLDEDRIGALGGVDAVGEGDELLLELEPQLQGLHAVLLRQPVPS